MSAGLSRRGFFEALRRPFRAPGAGGDAGRPGAAGVATAAAATGPGGPGGARTALIQGRFCLALSSFCSVCLERCPVPGALRRERGLPMVVADVCTGCGLCHDVCPAPRNAILMLPRRPSGGAPPSFRPLSP